MENAVNKYETVFVLNATLTEEATAALVQKFADLIASDTAAPEINEIGKRKLAYLIDDMSEGYYVQMDFSATPKFVAELERIFGITEGVMRSIIVRKPE
ncbi:MAG: 30S ribosomal protein S6 [Clostridia bacterium]|nr:30S ribosomal protein S6 [Clostridia bacterium]